MPFLPSTPLAAQAKHHGRCLDLFVVGDKWFFHVTVDRNLRAQSNVRWGMICMAMLNFEANRLVNAVQIIVRCICCLGALAIGAGAANALVVQVQTGVQGCRR